MRKLFFLMAALFCCAVLTACGGTAGGAQNVEELLRAPRVSARQGAVQSALNEYLGEPLQLKYPRSGSEPDPMLFCDMNGDGRKEAIVLYTAVESKGQNVHLAVLEDIGKDRWKIAYEVRGLSTEVVEVETVGFLDRSTQLVVGYANSNLTDKYLEVYDYRDMTLYSLCKLPYESYSAEDVTGDFVPDLSVVSGTPEPGALTLNVFSSGGDTRLKMIETVTLDSRMERCTDLMPTQSGVDYGIVVNGTTAAGQASRLLRWREGHLQEWPESTEERGDPFTRSQRPNALSGLRPSALVSRGTVLIPEVGKSIPTLQSANRFYPVEWKDYLSSVPLRQFGIYDAVHNFYLRLPSGWKENLAISSQTENDWQIRSKNENELLCSVKISEQDVGGMYYEAARLAEKKVFVSFGENCSVKDETLIRHGAIALE